ncbi:MAG: HD domain-containing protein [Coriobacteriia bacterium]|nr:HD domain-containing protein [Coriobacteriia bacterium]
MLLVVLIGLVALVSASREVLTDGGWAISLSLGALWALTAFLGVRLGRGDMVYIDASLGLSALVLFTPGQVVLASAIGGLAGVLLNPRERSSILERCSEIGRKILVLATLVPLAGVVATTSKTGLGTIGAQATLLGFGFLYAASDLLTAAFSQSLRRGSNLLLELVRLARPIAVIYLGHITTGVVIVLLFDSLGYVGLLVMITLVLMMQNSFNLLLRIKTAYQETIQALVHASELQLPGEAGHARRVAEMATHAGRQLGLSSENLELVGYAALLHDIGKIGVKADAEGAISSEHAQIGADIVAQIPFVDSVAPIVGMHERPTQCIATISDTSLSTAVLLVKASSRLDRAVSANVGTGPLQAIDSPFFDDFRESPLGTRVINALALVVRDWTRQDLLQLGGTSE